MAEAVQQPQSDTSSPSGKASTTSDGRPQWRAGITPASVLACICCMFLLSMLVQYGEVVLGFSMPLGEQTLALPAMWIGMILLGVVGLAWGLARLRILTRPELLCVFYAMFISAPLMSQGFWHRLIAITATIPKSTEQWDKLDSFNDNLWPHGPNLVVRGLDESRKSQLPTQGTVAWEDVELERGSKTRLPVLSNSALDDVSTLRLRVPVVGRDSGPAGIVRNEPYLFSILVRGRDLGPNSRYFCRAYEDDREQFQEIFSSNAAGKVTGLHPTGFQRVGAYGTRFPGSLEKFVDIELALNGVGRLELADIKLMNVAALEGIYKGQPIVRESDYLNLPEAGRAGLIVKPDNMWSWSGLKFVIAGYIPLRDWLMPAAVWSGFMILLMVAFVAVNSIMRKQWMDNERYMMPMTRIPMSLLGENPDAPGASAPMWKNGWMWAGLAVGGAYMLAKIWKKVNPDIMNVSINWPVKDLFSGAWGGMFDATFNVDILFLSLCLFMELNVLLSIVIGFWAFRSQYWIGNNRGWSITPNYPFGNEQQFGAFIAYGLLIIVLSWRYLLGVLKAAVKNDKLASVGELFSYRTAILLLIACFVLAGGWAWWVGIPVSGVVSFFGGVVLIAMVSAKLRTECGTPYSEFTPYYLPIILTVIGGISVFGTEAMVFCFVASFFLGPVTFFLIPGGQMELMELGRRWQVRPSHIRATLLLAMLGGLLLGGWAFLSNAYSLSGETLRYQWAFDTKPWYFQPLNPQVDKATQALMGRQSTADGTDPVWYAYGYSAGMTVVLATLRQIFSWFWFHPIGFVVGATPFAAKIWGSALVAWLIRRVVLWMGGAATIRSKLQPFAVGMFIGGVFGEFTSMAITTFFHSLGRTDVFNG